jgi:hypothetical protein
MPNIGYFIEINYIVVFKTLQKCLGNKNGFKLTKSHLPDFIPVAMKNKTKQETNYMMILCNLAKTINLDFS